MRRKETSLSITAASPSAAGTAVAASSFKTMWAQHAKELVLDAAITAGTGGTLDVYLQRKLATNSWVDWVHFPQVTAGATARYSVAITGLGGSITTVGGGTDAAPGVALAAGSVANVMPGDEIRIVYVAGAGTSAAGSATITVTPYKDLV